MAKARDKQFISKPSTQYPSKSHSRGISHPTPNTTTPRIGFGRFCHSQPVPTQKTRNNRTRQQLIKLSLHISYIRAVHAQAEPRDMPPAPMLICRAPSQCAHQDRSGRWAKACAMRLSALGVVGLGSLTAHRSPLSGSSISDSALSSSSIAPAASRNTQATLLVGSPEAPITPSASRSSGLNYRNIALRPDLADGVHARLAITEASMADLGEVPTADVTEATVGLTRVGALLGSAAPELFARVRRPPTRQGAMSRMYTPRGSRCGQRSLVDTLTLNPPPDCITKSFPTEAVAAAADASGFMLLVL